MEDKIKKLEGMWSAIEMMPEEVQRFCIECIIGEYDAKTMKKELLKPFLKIVCMLKPELINGVAQGVLKKCQKMKK